MSLRVLSEIALGLGVPLPLSADSITNGGHVYAPGGLGFNRPLPAPVLHGQQDCRQPFAASFYMINK
jgi:hypothetical protein